MKKLNVNIVISLGLTLFFASSLECFALTEVVSPEFSRVSVSSSGQQANIVGGYSGSYRPSISSDGRYVAFNSSATNLVAGDTNWSDDVFVHDRVAKTTELVSVSSGGIQGDSYSGTPSISSDGRYVAFHSSAANLAAEDSDSATDVFVRDRVSQTTELVSISLDGIQGHGINSAISADGRYVAFESFASDLVPGDTNFAEDIFVRDCVAGTTELVSVSSGGVQGNGWSNNASISSDGRYVAFHSSATTLVVGDSNSRTDIFVRDRVAKTTELMSISSSGIQSEDYSNAPSISSDGRYVAFESWGSNLVSGDYNLKIDIFVRDSVGGSTELVSVSSGGTQGNANSTASSISPDGRYVTFDSSASNLVPDDNNGKSDVFIHDRKSHQTVCLTCSATSITSQSSVSVTDVNSLGEVAFNSPYAGLVLNDTNKGQDIFVSTPVFVDSIIDPDPDPNSEPVIPPILHLLLGKTK